MDAAGAVVVEEEEIEEGCLFVPTPPPVRRCEAELAALPDDFGCELWIVFEEATEGGP